jgi:hypothetical protein
VNKKQIVLIVLIIILSSCEEKNNGLIIPSEFTNDIKLSLPINLIKIIKEFDLRYHEYFYFCDIKNNYFDKIYFYNSNNLLLEKNITQPTESTDLLYKDIFTKMVNYYGNNYKILSRDPFLVNTELPTIEWRKNDYYVYLFFLPSKLYQKYKFRDDIQKYKVNVIDSRICISFDKKRLNNMNLKEYNFSKEDLGL